MSPTPPEIKNPRRILILGLPSSGKLTLLKNLKAPLPAAIPETHAGLSSSIPLRTSYYTTTLPIWLEDLPPPAELQTFTSSYLAPEAAPVLDAVGAWVYTFTTLDAAVLRALEKVVGTREVVCLAVKKTGEVTEEEEMMGRGCGFEVVAGEARGRNEYGEKVGMERVWEALEANDWTADDDGGILDDGDEDEEFGEFKEGEERKEGKADERGRLGAIGDEMEREMASLHLELEGLGEGKDGEEDELDVEKLEGTLQRLTMLKEMGDDMNPEEKKRLAAKAIAELMK